MEILVARVPQQQSSTAKKSQFRWNRAIGGFETARSTGKLGSLANSSTFSIGRPILAHAINCLKPSGILIWMFDGRCAAFVIVTVAVTIAADGSG
jgi:hypothetical protein